jgi:hypothetical protein
MRRLFVAVGIAALLVWMGCSDDGESLFRDGNDAGNTTGPGPFGGGDSGLGGDGGFSSCEDGGCQQGAVCKYGLCVPDLGKCATNDDCPGDSYCDTDLTCVPYGVPPTKINDPTCAKPFSPGALNPTVQCEWSAPAAGDPTAAFVNVYSAPIVADLNLDLDKNKLQPSVILTTWAQVNGPDGGNERIGVLRVFDGRTCAEQMRIGGPDDPNVEQNRPAYGTQWAVGDLDGDVNGTTNTGHPEIVGLHRTTATISTNPPLSLIAFRIDASGSTPKLVKKWEGRICNTDGGAGQVVTFGTNTDNYGPSIHDLDDDGKPEVILDTNVFDQNGCLLNPPAKYDPYVDHGQISTIADVDLDGKPDLVRGDGVYGWNTTTKQWSLKPYFTKTAAHKPGHVAVANLGAYSVIPGKVATDPLPEIIVVSAETTAFEPQSSGTVRVQTLTGQIVFSAPLFKFSQQHGGHGGPPTAADFDGDGQIEFAAAANEFYTVYDPDCLPGGAASARPNGKCIRPITMTAYDKDAGADSGIDGGALPLDGILWARPSQDFSSSETGSSIFDFNGDGKSEAVYRDECYLRVYDGPTGNVVFSAQAGSGTGQELPVICDVDGDFATEIVVARSTNNPTCPATDPLATVDAGTPDGGFVKKGGFVILRDPQDRWAASRPIWNQHAYSITNVTDDGRIPKSSAWLRNWEQPGLNNFRQNTQGDLGKLALADLTAELRDLNAICSGASGTVPIKARICNRGTNPVQDGVVIQFFATPLGSGLEAGVGQSICQAPTGILLKPGDCTEVGCTGLLPANNDVYVVVDPSKSIADCHPGNNEGASARVLCPVVK